MMSYQGNDSTPSLIVGTDLGIRLNFWMDVVGGGLSTLPIYVTSGQHQRSS